MMFLLHPAIPRRQQPVPSTLIIGDGIDPVLSGAGGEGAIADWPEFAVPPPGSELGKGFLRLPSTSQAHYVVC